MKPLVINLTLFKIGWLAAVFAAAAMMPVLGTATIALVVAVHLYRSEQRRAESLLLITSALIGVTWESLLVQAGVLSYTSGTFAAGVAPYWIVAMWLLFATTLNVGMRWLRNHWIVASIAGAVGGPMSFLAGAKTGAVVFTDTTTALIVISAGWAVILPLLVQIADAFEPGSGASDVDAELAQES